jgi:YD repeat-containing protein
MTLGNNTKQEDWISGTSYASSTKTYTGYGLIATSTDRNGNATAFVYDLYNLFAASTTNPLLQKAQAYYNYANGKMKQSTDPNSRLTKYLFDGLGRLTELDQSSTSTPAIYATTTTYVYTDTTSTPSLIHRADYLGPSNTVDAFSYYDGFNRLIQERKQSQTSNTYATTDHVFNGAGEEASTSLPYFSSGSSFTSPTTNATLYNNLYFDPFQRVTTASNANGSTNNTYYQWRTTTTDPNGNIKDYGKDAFGNLVNVVEHTTGSLATTTYMYDALNDLATTTDALGNVRHFTYDGLGRRLTAQDLHATTDTTFGTTTYSYDAQGNLTSQTDPKGQVVNRTYDPLNRMLTEDYTGAAGTEVTLTYDSCTNGIGFLCTASSTGSFASSTYDILGRVATSAVKINNTSYTMAYSYDRQGNVTALNYPDGSQVKVSFNLAGLPSKIQRKASGGSFSDVMTNYDYAPQGQIQNALFGNNASTTYFYDANAMYRLSNLQTTGANSTSIQKFSYTYDPVGNITQLTNYASSTAAASLSYSYDTLNRLLGATTNSASSSPFTQNYTYDILGNIITSPVAYATSTATTSPSILDTTPLTVRAAVNTTSDSISYTVPSGGNNKLLVVLMGKNQTSDPNPTMALNGASLTTGRYFNTQGNLAAYFYGYLAAPTSGTFQVTFPQPTYADYVIFTVQHAAQSNPIDTTNVGTTLSGTSVTVSTSTTVGYDLLLSYPWFSRAKSFHRSAQTNHRSLPNTTT